VNLESILQKLNIKILELFTLSHSSQCPNDDKSPLRSWRNLDLRKVVMERSSEIPFIYFAEIMKCSMQSVGAVEPIDFMSLRQMWIDLS